jgi:uncharacterized protein YcaQ
LARLSHQALTAIGVATTGDVARYYNLSPTQAAHGLTAAEAIPVHVEGWARPALLPALMNSRHGYSSHVR